MMLLVLFLDMGRHSTRAVMEEDRLEPCEIQRERRFSVVTLKEDFRRCFLRGTKKGSRKCKATVIPGTGLHGSRTPPPGATNPFQSPAYLLGARNLIHTS